MKIKKVFTRFLMAAMFIIPFIPVAQAAEKGNDHPVVLVHGNGGWGRGEKNGFLYWGGDVDIQEKLNAKGYKVQTAVVGPYSSNWDRACDLYAYIKGGTVDYGKAHSEKFGHARYGRTFKGLYPAWGTNSADKTNKVHLLGHSQGGHTSRILVELLEDGMQAEIEAVLGPDPTEEQIQTAVEKGLLSKLFTGTCNNWVVSVTTFATPHDGTTFANVVGKGHDLITFLAVPLGGITGLTDEINYLDLKLDHWGLHRNENESFLNYFMRVLNSELWKGTKDFSLYDLTTMGAREMNSWVGDQEDVYYFSYSCQATVQSPFTEHHLPDYNYMNPLFTPGTMMMGTYTNESEGVDSQWFPNDGYGNTLSEIGPTTGRSTDNIVEYNGSPVVGTWNHLGTLDETDHEDIIGRDTSDQMGDLIEFYSNHIDMLLDL